MWANFTGFLEKPYSAEMSALDWFFFIGLLLVILVLWGIILRHIREAV